MKLSKTLLMVRGLDKLFFIKNLSIFDYEHLLLEATIPKSPISFIDYRSYPTVLPQAFSLYDNYFWYGSNENFVSHSQF